MKTNKINDRRISRFIKQSVIATLLLGLAAGILIFPTAETEAAASQFDQTFGTAGKVITDFNGGTDDLRDLAIQADGKIVAVGYSNGFAVARYNINGTLDITFDGDGKLTTNAQGLTTAWAVAIQPDGKIVVGGESDSSFALARYNSDGALDTTFDADGIVLTPLAGTGIRDIVIQPDGKIVAVGDSATAPDFAVARYNSDGSLDTSFDSDGYVTTSIASFDNPSCIALQPDGKIIAAGSSGNISQYSLVRYNSNGSLDTSFDTDGILTVAIGSIDVALKVMVQPDGKIIAAGTTGSDMSVIRLLPSGALDTTFDSDGKATADFGGNEAGFAAALQPDGKIILAGARNANGIALARFNPNGSLDTSFHGDGKLTTPIEGNNDQAFAVAIQPDGRIVAGGRSGNNFVLARFLGDPRSLQTNGGAIAPADRIDPANPPGVPATNYPSIINVGGLNGAVTKVRVTLSNVTHTYPRDFDILLESPGGQRTMLMSDAGATSSAVTGLNYVFDQTAAAAISLTGSLSGIYKPFNYNHETDGIDNFPSPGAGNQNYGAANLDVFNGTNPNGQWKLYVVDDEADDTGSIGGWTLDITTTTSRLNNLPSDFDGDGKTDVSIYRSSNGQWWYSRSTDLQERVVAFGTSSDKIVPGDFTGDGRSDIAIWRPASGEWFIVRSENGSFFSFPFGASGDIPAPSDYDGDGRTDTAVFRPSEGIWYIRRSSDLGVSIVPFGISTDKPVAADYDGDGKSDVAIFRPSDGSWWYLRSIDSQFRVFRFGVGTDKPVQGDWTGDGKADIAVWRPSDGVWYVQRSEDNSFYSVPFGTNGDLPAPGDYDGDGKTDTAVFRPSDNTWYIQRSTAGLAIQRFGINGDFPTPSAFIP